MGQNLGPTLHIGHAFIGMLQFILSTRDSIFLCLFDNLLGDHAIHVFRQFSWGQIHSVAPNFIPQHGTEVLNARAGTIHGNRNLGHEGLPELAVASPLEAEGEELPRLVNLHVANGSTPSTIVVGVLCDGADFLFVVQHPLDTSLKGHLVVASSVSPVDSQPLPALRTQWLTIGEAEHGLLNIRTLWVQVGNRIDATTEVQLVWEVDFAESFVPLGNVQGDVETNPVTGDLKVL